MKGLVNKNVTMYFYQTAGGWWAVVINGDPTYYMFYWQAVELWARTRDEYWVR